MTYKTTKKDFEIFKKECLKWIEYFQLSGWKFCFFHEDNKQLGKALGWSCGNYMGRVASIGISLNWGDDKANILDLKRTAFHEVCEIMLCSLHVLAFDRNWDEDIWDAESHTVIRILENSVFKESL